MGSQFDYIGSLIIGGLITVIVFSLNATITRTAFQRNTEQISQDYATNMMEIIENDIYQIGYRISSTTHILVAESLKFSFLGDIDNSGTADSLTYTVGDSTELSRTSNVHDRPLYRKVNNNARQNIILGLTKFKFTYIDTGGYTKSYSSLTTQANRYLIRSIGISLTVEPSDPIDTLFVPVSTSRRIQPKNLGGW